MTTTKTRKPAYYSRWVNWSGVSTAQPRKRISPRDEAELVQLIQRAAASGEKVKPIGAGHSFTSVAATEGIQVSLDNLAGLIHFDRQKMTARLRAGTRLRDVPGILAPLGVALANQGDVDPQSLAGAIGTSTHGTGLGFTGFAGMLRAFRIITPDGQAHECFPGAEGIAGELYDIARVSLGAYGIITEVELDVVETFVLHAVERAEPNAPLVESFADRARQEDHLEFYWFPGTDVAHVKTNTRLPGDTPTHPIPRWKEVLDDELLNNGAYRVMNDLAHHFPSLTKPFAHLSAKTLAQREYSNVAHGVFVSSRRVRFNEMEYSVPLTDAREVLREVQRTMNTCGERVLFPIEVRATAADDVPLSTAKGRESCYIAVHRYNKDSHQALFRHVEPIFKEAQSGRPHWGKLHTLTHEDLLERHEDLARACEIRAKVDPQGMMRNAMIDRVFGLA
ncbi:D-arabinono-1,4-lactone oxidase [uncultured Corynebacterium sp.]|uniref:D-arabinono-1,4-lactone oxidase n=1 Tax=uncultured Corynebacterium sp. TaxID=159447 RepID=UPI0025FF30FF|nr:D-arabinono-1,4-lactone oxidase [uncultured Corynebacterium sp.]